MAAKSPKRTIRAKVMRALRAGKKPIEIARKLGVPLLLIAEIVLRESGGKFFDV
jgi:hypothetical protein